MWTTQGPAMCSDAVELGKYPVRIPCTLYLYHIRKTTVMLRKMLAIEGTWALYPHMTRKPWQVFVTRSEHLATKCRQSFETLHTAHILGNHLNNPLEGLERTMVDEDEEAKWKLDLPSRLGQLRDEHFPLFISFGRVSAYHHGVVSDSDHWPAVFSARG